MASLVLIDSLNRSIVARVTPDGLIGFRHMRSPPGRIPLGAIQITVERSGAHGTSRSPVAPSAFIATLVAAPGVAVVSVVHSATTAGGVPYAVHLDVPADNADGEPAGGLSTGMTTDVAELRAALDVVGAARVAPGAVYDPGAPVLDGG